MDAEHVIGETFGSFLADSREFVEFFDQSSDRMRDLTHATLPCSDEKLALWARILRPVPSIAIPLPFVAISYASEIDLVRFLLNANFEPETGRETRGRWAIAGQAIVAGGWKCATA